MAPRLRLRRAALALGLSAIAVLAGCEFIAGVRSIDETVGGDDGMAGHPDAELDPRDGATGAVTDSSRGDALDPTHDGEGDDAGGAVPDSGVENGGDASVDTGVEDAADDGGTDSTALDAAVETGGNGAGDASVGDAAEGGGVGDASMAAGDTGTDGASDTGAADAGCLANIPSTCPDCAVQNQTDLPVCEKYLTCYQTNNCNPSTSCGSANSICGVNTIGGGTAPQGFAIATYNCACP